MVYVITSYNILVYHMLVLAQQLRIEVDAVYNAHLFEESGFARLASAKKKQLDLQKNWGVVYVIQSLRKLFYANL